MQRDMQSDTIEKCGCGCEAFFREGTGIRDTKTHVWYVTPAHRSAHSIRQIAKIGNEGST